MARVKGGKISQKRRKHLLAYTKGFRWGRKSKLRAARQAALKAGQYAWRDRRAKKRDFRRLWQVKINALARENNWKYSRLVHALKTKKVDLDRKILSRLAEQEPDVFRAILEQIKD